MSQLKTAQAGYSRTPTCSHDPLEEMRAAALLQPFLYHAGIHHLHICSPPQRDRCMNTTLADALFSRLKPCAFTYRCPRKIHSDRTTITQNFIISACFRQG